MVIFIISVEETISITNHWFWKQSSRYLMDVDTVMQTSVLLLKTSKSVCIDNISGKYKHQSGYRQSFSMIIQSTNAIRLL